MGYFFSDALRRILFLLLLMFIISVDLDRFGVGRGLLLWAIFSPTRCVCVSSWWCCCCCNTVIVNCFCYLANLQL